MITEQYAEFFQGLAANNHRDWFHEHKEAYENHVKQPFLELVEQLIYQLKELEPFLSPDPKETLFRINRDVRFANDKTPYNTLMKAGFSPMGKKSFHPGYYLGISADTIHVGGGLFNLKTPELNQVRELIAEDPRAFNRIVNAPAFLEKFGELKGEKAKRLPKEIKHHLKKAPLIANKQFYAMAELPLTGHIDSEDLPDTIMEYFRVIDPLNQYLKKAF